MVRRLSNTNHEETNPQEVLQVIETYTQQLKSSGYERGCAREAVTSGVLGWLRKIERRKKEGTPFYRSARSTLRQRCKKKIMEKTTWYKTKRKREDDGDPQAAKKHCVDKSRKGMQEGERKRVEHLGAEIEKQEEMHDKTKAVMFVPFTWGSELAKRLRKAEEQMVEMTGTKIKIVERAGTKLEDILTKADPWQGADCARERCLLCSTKQKTGKNLTQDCFRRNSVYETWCITCLERDKKNVEMQAGEDTKLQKELEKNIRVHKYIGETNRSVFERGWEHLNDYHNLSTKSHMLKHAVEMHPQEDLKAIQFGMKVVRYTKSAFDRQICESVEIQGSRNHHLLNSRSEYNRCAVPRMMCKLGDQSFKKNEQEIEKDLHREENQVRKIREMVKERNKKRAEIHRIHGAAPGAKRRKINENRYEVEQEKRENLEMHEPQKRKEETPPTESKKRRLNQDIRLKQPNNQGKRAEGHPQARRAGGCSRERYRK